MKKYIFKVLFLFVFIGFVPGVASAANIYLEASRNTVSVGDTFIVSAKIDSDKVSINSVEGDIVLSNNNQSLVVNDFSLAKSVFSLWPRTPSLSLDGNTISFVGGVPGGFNLDKNILFSVIFQADKEGEITISPKDISIFANDGKGTKVAVNSSGLTIKVLAKNEKMDSSNEWINLVSSDKINPEDFDVIVGKDDSLFEGKRFAFFTAVDNQSGISYYEVSEDGAPVVRSGSMYLLNNQDNSKKPDLKVFAYDKAGNKTLSVYKDPGIRIFGFSLNFIIIVLVIVVALIVIRKIIKVKRSKKNAQANQ